MRITIAGTGYVGLVTGVCLASRGHHITCMDPDETRIHMLQQGKAPFYEAELESLMEKHRDKLTYTTDNQAAYCDADVIIIGVGTPEKKDGSANLKYVYDVADQIAVSVESDCVVALKSTVPIGTCERIELYIRERMKHGSNVSVVSNPEFLAQGTAVRDTMYPARIVIGSQHDDATETMLHVYEGFTGVRVCTDRKSAEMIKYASNDFLALKISYVNEIANLCEQVGADIEAVTYGMGLDDRIGDKFMKAGIGYGGSCFPKDTRALNWFANFNDQEIKTIKAAIEVNEQQKLRLIKKAKKYYTSFAGLRVAVLGLTFKPETDDLREAPSLVNIPWLLEEGAVIRAWDPAGAENFARYVQGDISYCSTIEEALQGAELCFIFTEWKQIRELDINVFSEHMACSIVLDGRNCFSLEQFRGTGILYDSIGRRPVEG